MFNWFKKKYRGEYRYAAIVDQPVNFKDTIRYFVGSYASYIEAVDEAMQFQDRKHLSQDSEITTSKHIRIKTLSGRRGAFYKTIMDGRRSL